MTITLARCQTTLSASVNRIQYFAKLYQFFQNSTVFTIKSYNSSSSHLILTHIEDGWDFLIDASNTHMDIAIDPAGGATFDGSTPTGSSQWSGTVRTLTGTNDTFDELMHIVEYPDAVLLGIKHSSGSYWRSGFHAGKIYSPFNANDPDKYIDGFGIMAGNPEIFSVYPSWMRTDADINSTDVNALSSTRVSQTTWSKNQIRTDNLFNPTANLLNGARLIPYIYAIGEGGGDASGFTALGFTKYLRRYKVASPHLSMINSDGTDQAFLVFAGSNQNSSLCCLWSKAVNPTIDP